MVFWSYFWTYSATSIGKSVLSLLQHFIKNDMAAGRNKELHEHGDSKTGGCNLEETCENDAEEIREEQEKCLGIQIQNSESKKKLPVAAGQTKRIVTDENSRYCSLANKEAFRFNSVNSLFGNRTLNFGKGNENKQAKPVRRPKIQTNRPIIGILSQSISRTEPNHPSYIAASFVKCLESSGARVVPIMNNLTEAEIEKLFYSINGVLFPGGAANLKSSGYAKVGRVFYNLAIKSFDEGDYFPLWGTCLGFQFLAVLASDNVNICSQTDSHDLSLPLEFSQDYLDSNIFRDISTDLAEYLRSAPTTFNAHHWSLTVDAYEKNQNLKNVFKVVSTNHDRKGIEFVSTMEARRYPFYATQWHPEKNSFEWTLQRDMPHDAMSIKVAQYMSNFFVNEARYSKHKFNTVEEEQDALIYNFSPVYTGKKSIFEQVYLFNCSNSEDHERRSFSYGKLLIK